MYLDPKLLERNFKKAKEEVAAPLPKELSHEDIICFTRILSCTSIDEVEDISSETISEMFDKIQPFAELMSNPCILQTQSFLSEMRMKSGICPRRIL